MEIVTIVIKGEITHRDSLNNLGIIHEDEVQVMSAGTGITHSEKNEKIQTVNYFRYGYIRIFKILRRHIIKFRLRILLGIILLLIL